jgi:hypothetical protein
LPGLVAEFPTVLGVRGWGLEICIRKLGKITVFWGGNLKKFRFWLEILYFLGLRSNIEGGRKLRRAPSPRFARVGGKPLQVHLCLQCAYDTMH